jgi:hypothetical protein
MRKGLIPDESASGGRMTERFTPPPPAIYRLSSPRLVKQTAFSWSSMNRLALAVLMFGILFLRLHSREREF